MPGYTNVPKPTGANYSTTSPIGKQAYDDVNTTYDDPTSFYDGIESGVWTNIAKPTGSVYSYVTKPT